MNSTIDTNDSKINIESQALEPYAISIDEANTLLTTPFIPEIYKPLKDKASKRLKNITKENLPESLKKDFIECFIQSIAKILNPLLIQRFSAFRLVSNPLWRPTVCPPGKHPFGLSAPRQMLDAYIKWEKEQELLDFGGPYPELARLISVSLENWQNLVTEILNRTHAHSKEIANVLNIDIEDLAPLSNASFGISDPHNNGRTAAILSFGKDKITAEQPLFYLLVKTKSFTNLALYSLKYSFHLY